MRSIPIPVDVSRLAFVVVTDPRPRLVSQDTGEAKTTATDRPSARSACPPPTRTGGSSWSTSPSPANPM